MTSRCILLLAIFVGITAGQMQLPPDQQQNQFGVPPQQQQQQQFQGVPGQQQQQQIPGQFPQQPIEGQGFGQQPVGGSNFVPGGAPNQPQQPQQPPTDQFGHQSSQPQFPGQSFGGQGFGGQQQQQQIPPGQAGQQGQQGQQGFGGPMPAVKITTDLFSVDVAQHADRLMWSEPRSDVVYCVSSNPTTNLQFYCFDCNTTYGQQFNEMLRSQTMNFQQVTGYPAIKLNPVPIVGEELFMKTLSCIATYGSAANAAPLNTTAASSIVLQFLSTPVLVDQQAHGPLYVNPHDGYQFYVPQQGGFTLFCVSRGNPPPTGYNWTVNGAPVPNAGTAPQLRVDAQTYTGKAITCKAYSQVYPLGRESTPAGIMTWIPPTMTGNNFQELQQQSGLFEQGTSNVQLGKRALVQCSVVGVPFPWIWWRQEISAGYVVNASCDGGRQDTAPTMGANGYSVTSSCSVLIDTYEKSGRYWCSGCNYLSSGTYQCVPDERQVSTSSVRIDVIGQPLIPQDEPPRYEQDQEGRTVKIGVQYCSNPEPALPDGIYWEISGKRLNIRNEMENYRAEAPEPNATVPNCWIAPLRIHDVSESDRSKTYRLTVANQVGSVYREFQLSQLNTTRSAISTEGVVGLAVGLTLGFLFLILLILCAFCWWKKLLCFGKTRKRQPKPSQPKQPKEKFQTNVPADTVRVTPDRLTEKMPPPLSRPPYDYPPTETLHVNGASSPGGRRKHEGLNYAELDLVKDSHRPLQPTIAPTSVSSTQHRPPASDYARFQPPSTQATQLKSPTNSTV